jgi:hypothetical protein
MRVVADQKKDDGTGNVLKGHGHDFKAESYMVGMV